MGQHDCRRMQCAEPSGSHRELQGPAFDESGKSSPTSMIAMSWAIETTATVKDSAAGIGQTQDWAVSIWNMRAISDAFSIVKCNCFGQELTEFLSHYFSNETYCRPGKTIKTLNTAKYSVMTADLLGKAVNKKKSVWCHVGDINGLVNIGVASGDFQMVDERDRRILLYIPRTKLDLFVKYLWLALIIRLLG